MVHALEKSLGELTAPQSEAVQWDKGAMLVLAGPGSGKTRVLTCRIARLLDESRNQRFRILALTFTNKAAREMALRVTQLVPGLEDRAVINTFHGFCAEVLRQHGVHVGVKTDYTIFSLKADRQAVLDAALRGAGQRYGHDGSRLLSQIDTLKSRLIRPEQAEDSLVRLSRMCSVEAARITRAYRLYEKELRQANALDFNSLLLKAYELFGYSVMVRQYQKVYRYWLIDEFQDTNKAQYQLLRRLADDDFRDIFAVADDDQVIYEWNGASVDRIEDFRRDFCSEITHLPTNFRCPPRIVEAANRLVAKNYRRVVTKPHAKAAQPKTSKPAHPIQCREFSTDADEARGIAGEIERLDSDARNGTAVLARNRYLLESVRNALKDCSVPAAVLKRREDFLTPEMRWLVACLDQLNRPRDLRSFRTVVESFNELFSDLSLDLDELVSQAGVERITCFSLWIERVSQVGLQPPAATYVSIIEGLRTGKLKPKMATRKIIDEFERDNSNHDLQTDLRAWRQLWEKLRASSPEMTLIRFLQQLELHSKEPDVPRGTVRLATIHGAKGLEFDTVYLIGMAEDILPSWRSVRPGKDSAALEEERRSCFVAITRASRYLNLSWAREYNGRRKQPSRFLEEMFAADDLAAPHVQVQFFSVITPCPHSCTSLLRTPRDG